MTLLVSSLKSTLVSHDFKEPQKGETEKKKEPICTHHVVKKGHWRHSVAMLKHGLVLQEQASLPMQSCASSTGTTMRRRLDFPPPALITVYSMSSEL